MNATTVVFETYTRAAEAPDDVDDDAATTMRFAVPVSALASDATSVYDLRGIDFVIRQSGRRCDALDEDDALDPECLFR